MNSVMMLEGGSYRGIYTSGILDVFMEHEVYPDCVVGVSAGALNGIGYVGHQPGRCRDVVLSFGLDPRYLGTRALRHEHNLVGFDFILRQMQDILPFDAETFYHGGMDFYAAAVNLSTGRQEYFHQNGPRDIMTAVAASCSMPYFCRKVEMDGQYYLDGGIGRHLPLSFLEEHPEYDRVVVVLTRRTDYPRKAPGGAMKNLARRLYHDYPALLENIFNEAEIYRAERQELMRLAGEGKILLVQPDEELPIGRLERNRQNLRDGYDAGRVIGNRTWETVRDYLTEPVPV